MPKKQCPEMNHFLDTTFGGEFHHQTAKKGLPHFYTKTPTKKSKKKLYLCNNNTEKIFLRPSSPL